MLKEDGENTVPKNVKPKLNSMVNGLNVIIVARKFIGVLKILNVLKAKSFFVLLLAIVHGKTRIDDVVKTLQIG